jgi:hypothetical protein
MKFSAPIYILKQQAKAFSRKERIPLRDALDQIAKREGFGSWSLLAAKWNAYQASMSLSSQLRPGELVLISPSARTSDAVEARRSGAPHDRRLPVPR